MVRLPLAFLIFTAVHLAGAFDEPPTLPAADRIRIAEAFRLADAIGNQVWPEWDKAPFAVLLVTPEHEFLIRHPKPSTDFTPAAGDGVGSHKVWVRKRQFPVNLLATFPAVGGVSTIVIGQAQNTEAKTSSRWVITLLHEHFHQLQYSQPRYYPDVDGLGLAKEDKTGMWMLNYPFPYAEAKVSHQFAVLSQALGRVLKARSKPEFADTVKVYLAEKTKFKDLLRPDDYKYLAFQFWQEGIARYTEYHLALRAAAGDEPSKEFQALADFKPYKEVAATILDRIEKQLDTMQLDKSKREVVYNFGAAEGLVLDRFNPGWQNRYHDDRFSLDSHFQPRK